MEIADIKNKLTLSMVLHHYGLKPDKNARLRCPFHEDKTPSMQVYYKTHTAYCFSGACKTHGKSIDVIDFIMHRENCTKHEAIKKAEQLISPSPSPLNPPKGDFPKSDLSSAKSPSGGFRGLDITREQFLSTTFQYFKNAVHSSKPAKDYLSSRCLDFNTLEIGYNSAQFHHGARKNETLINRCLQYGLLSDEGLTGRTGEPAYRIFGKYCIVFPLKDVQHQVAGLYFRSVPGLVKGIRAENDAARHFYLRDRAGLYPHYPAPDAQTLILTESVIDAASLSYSVNQLISCSVLACYGTNGLTEEHRQAIKSLAQLEEIIFAFDMDNAGKEAVGKYAAMFRDEYPKLKITTLDLPCKDVNETLQGHDKEIFTHLIQNQWFVIKFSSFRRRLVRNCKVL